MGTSNNIIYWIVGFAAIGIIGYIYYRSYKKKRISRVDDIIQSGAEIKHSVNSTTEDVAAPSFAPIIKNFKGQCNSFTMVANSPRNIDYCEQVFGYADKILEFHGNDEIKKWWLSFAKDRNHWDLAVYSNKAKKILTIIREAGVTPSTEKILKWNEDASLHYIPFDELETDDTCNVIQPCWIYQNEIFEQGLVSKKVN